MKITIDGDVEEIVDLLTEVRAWARGVEYSIRKEMYEVSECSEDTKERDRKNMKRLSEIFKRNEWQGSEVE